MPFSPILRRACCSTGSTSCLPYLEPLGSGGAWTIVVTPAPHVSSSRRPTTSDSSFCSCSVRAVTSAPCVACPGSLPLQPHNPTKARSQANLCIAIFYANFLIEREKRLLGLDRLPLLGMDGGHGAG